MNRNQKIVLWVAIALLVLMGLIPPWTWTYKGHSRNEYAPIFHPHPSAFQSGHIGVAVGVGRVDFRRLFVQWITLGGASADVIFALKKP